MGNNSVVETIEVSSKKMCEVCRAQNFKGALFCESCGEGFLDVTNVRVIRSSQMDMSNLYKKNRAAAELNTSVSHWHWIISSAALIVPLVFGKGMTSYIIGAVGFLSTYVVARQSTLSSQQKLIGSLFFFGTAWLIATLLTP